MQQGLRICLLLLTVLSVGCTHHRNYHIKLPPVKEGWQQSSAGKNAYIVQKKDTLYSIAWAFGLDYRDLAKRNNLNPPYSIYRGQRLYIVSFKTTKNNFIRNKSNWSWPAQGPVVSKFDTKLGGNKGIDIKGNYDDPVLASSHGRVVYSGTGIRSYGKLIIIKHSDDYLSAYAYNKSILVHEGQVVSAGQKIAIIGNDNTGNICLHFEIRQTGKPVNPLLYLPKRP